MCRAMARSDSTLVMLNEKIKRFQRLKGLEIEIGTNRTRFSELRKRGATLVSLGGELMKKAIALLVVKWNELENEAKELASELEEAKDLLEFSAEFDNIEEWFKEKELMLSSGERGTDYEHCVALIRKADEAQSGVYEARIQNLLLMGEKLVKQGRTDKAMVAEKTSILVMRSNAIKLAIVDYRKALLAAIELHAFNRDFEDLHERIKHKAGLLGVDTASAALKTLFTVQRAQTQVADIEVDLKAIGEKLNKLENEANRIVNKYPEVTFETFFLVEFLYWKLIEDFKEI